MRPDKKRQSHHLNRRNQKVAPSKTRSKRLGRWFTACFAAVLVGVGVAFLGSHIHAAFKNIANRPVAAVEVDSELEKVSMAELQGVLEPLVTRPFLSINLETIKSSLEAHPWIAEVSLSRQWPDRLLVSLKEETAIARWQNTGFLNQAGKNIELENNSTLDNLPKLSGPDGSEITVARKFVEINNLVKPLNLSVWQLKLSEDLSWQVSLNNGLVLKLGRDQILEKIERFTGVYHNTLEPKLADIQSIDLRYRNGLAVRWQSQAVSSLN